MTMLEIYKQFVRDVCQRTEMSDYETFINHMAAMIQQVVEDERGEIRYAIAAMPLDCVTLPEYVQKYGYEYANVIANARFEVVDMIEERSKTHGPVEEYELDYP